MFTATVVLAITPGPGPGIGGLLHVLASPCWVWAPFWRWRGARF